MTYGIAGYEYRRDENGETWQPVDCDGQPTGPAVTVQPVTDPDTHEDTELVEPAESLRLINLAGVEVVDTSDAPAV